MAAGGDEVGGESCWKVCAAGVRVGDKGIRRGDG
eukprot:CAMPEP_0201994376 /NCGR_PEP_ID=MMETSP0905-20130828/2239_1 /ASSEMBLY_ACC=CAM_ASM_000554 /TAXON_ID=420261 /ORGANISM="Thalassiosira antarctica, Strain CCMP982" /LENGTH=33 /DNA_ID= /DNA_START= /DNA_END= /DNA_ORIENTATION=